MPFKVTSWNIEHAERLLSSTPTAAVLDRRSRIRQTLEEINPDILCMIEGPQGEAGADAFSKRVLNSQWVPVRLDSTAALGLNDKRYQQLGTQWIWFFVKPVFAPHCRVQDPVVWQSLTGGKTWRVNLWGQLGTSAGSHYRHPQLMIYKLPDGTELELIGVHLKSKINKKAIDWMDPAQPGQVFTPGPNDVLGVDYVPGEDYTQEALRARVGLAVEARNVREYVGAKFNQVPNPGVVIMGDCNDGPGQDYFENRYLFFDLVSNLQGEVLLAERYFNHALFDFATDLRWTAKYDDDIMGITAAHNPLLLDHILMSQPLCNGSLPVVVNAHAGLVEHQAFDRGNAGASSTKRTSDHRPVSCVFT